MPIKSKTGKVLSSEEQQNQEWVEHFSDVLNRPNPDSVYDFTNENEIDGNNSNITPADITCGKLSQATKTLNENNKASGIDNLPAALSKHGEDVMIYKLTGLGIVIWSSEEVPNEWTRGCIVKLPKKGSLYDCDNWRGITLVTIARKVVYRVLPIRLRKEIDLKLCENQARSRTGCSCKGHIFTLRNIIEQSLEYKVPMTINYIDFKKAFDSIHKSSLWNILSIYGVHKYRST